MEDMLAGNLDYGRCIATPDMMGIVGRLGKTLGPKGLMPNPKLGTVTPNVAEAVKAAKGGQIEFRVEKVGIIHAGLGRLSFGEEKLRQNFDAFVDAIVKRSEEHTSELQSLMRISYAVFCLKNKKHNRKK